MLKHKNAESLSILYDKYAPAIFGAMLRKTDNVELAEQILYQAFINIWNNPTFDNRYTKHLLLGMLNIANDIAEKKLSEILYRTTFPTKSINIFPVS